MGLHSVSWQRCEYRLYPQPKQVLDLATTGGCKAVSNCASSIPGCRAMGRYSILGWLTVFERTYSISVCNQSPRPTQRPTLCGTGNEYRPKCGDALRLGSKCRMAHSMCCGWQVNLCDPNHPRFDILYPFSYIHSGRR